MAYQSPGTIALAEADKAKKQDIALSEGGRFNHHGTLDRIVRYTRSQFMEDVGDDAIFRNISNQRIPLYAKSIDMDSKDFYTFGMGKTSWYQNWVLNVRFKKWVREKRFALTLDEQSTGIATFGSSVWKIFYNGGEDSNEACLEECNLQNLYFDGSVKNLIDSPLVELHYLTALQIKKRWPDKAEAILKTAPKQRDNNGNTSETTVDKYCIWERHGEFEDKNGKISYMWHIGAGQGDSEVVIYSKELAIDKRGNPIDFPYFDFHGERVKGRWLGVGVVERLFQLQEEMNTLVNQNSEAQNVASLLLFRTEDPNVAGNVLDQARSGQILNSPDLQQLGIDNRFLNEFINQVRLINEQADALCYIQESISGKTPPSGVPFRSVAMASRGAVSTFDYIKTHIGEKNGIVLQEKILPSLIKGFNKEDAVEISEDEFDIAAYDEAVTEKAIKNYKQMIAENGRVVFDEDIEELKMKVAEDLKRNRRIEKHGKNFFDFEYGVMMTPTGESLDKMVMNDALDGILTHMAATPALVNTVPFKKKLAINGIPPFQITMEQQQEIQGNTAPTPIPDAPQNKLAAQAAI